MGPLLSCGCISTIVGMHHLNVNETHGEKGRTELNKNVMCCFQQILEATPHKIAAEQPQCSHVTNHPCKMNKTCGAQ